MIQRLYSLAIVELMLSGCATVTRGIDNDVSFVSTPPGATVTTDLGLNCVAPCTMPIRRSEDFSATFTLEGYRAQTVNVRTVTAGAGVAGFAGNVLAGGVIGMALDASTGAMNDHAPNPVEVVLVPIGESPATPAAPEATPAPISAPRATGTPTS